MTRFTAWMVAVLSAVAIGLFGGAAPACACSCLPITERQAYDQADAVFVGTLVRSTQPRHPESSIDPVVLTFHVRALYKGKVHQYHRVRTAYSSASCGLDAVVGERYLIFAEWSEGRLEANLCGGSRPQTGVPTVAGHEPIRWWPKH